MSTDVIADALLPPCETSIKSLARFLTTLHSIDALGRLKEKADVVAAFSVIASFAPFLAPPPTPAPPTTVDDDGSSADAKLERFERRAETSRRDRLVVAEGREDETTVPTHTPILSHPPILEDGRDDGVLPPEEVLPSSQSVFGTSSQRVVPLEYLIHPVRKSETIPIAPKEKPLYSFLIHFPIFSALGARLSDVDREKLFSLPVMAKWGFCHSIAIRAFPRLRLTNAGTACVVVDNDLERFEEIRKDFEETEREIWKKSATATMADMLDRTFFLVGTWSEEHVALVFSSSSNTPRGWEVCPNFERWTTPSNLWKDILDVYPVLSQYQELAHGQEQSSRPLLGAGLFYQKQLLESRLKYSYHYVTLVVPLLRSPHTLMFVNDFVAQYSPISLVLNDGTESRANVRVVKMGPPVLKDDSNWDGPVLRNDEWLGGLDAKFFLS